MTAARTSQPADRRTVMAVSFAEVLGGAERSLLTLAQHLPARGWNPVVVCPPGRLADAAEQAGLRVERVPVRQARPVSRRSGGRKSYSARLALARVAITLRNALLIARTARRLDPALVHSNSLSSHLAVALGARLAGRPVLWHLREMIEPGPGRRVFNAVGRLTSGMVAISGAVAGTAAAERMHVVYNPVVEPPQQAAPSGWVFPRPRVGYVGRLDPRKGLEDLLEAAAMTDAHIVVVGKPWAGTADYVASLEELARSRAAGRVHFVGSVDEPWPALAAMDVLVVPSWAEPFGRVAVEGQRAGVPVLAADAGGLSEIVRDGHDGLLFPPRDPAALAACLTRVLTDAPLRARLVAAGRTSAARFDPATHAGAMAEVFSEHAATSAGARRLA